MRPNTKSNSSAPSASEDSGKNIGRVKAMAFSLIAMGLLVVFLEIFLQTAALFSSRVHAFLDRAGGKTIKDNILGHRPNPDFPDHDAWGFRNKDVPETVTVVAMGDSLTYGAMVAPEDAWPQQFQKVSGISTYNLAYGGYGPAHMLLLLDKALSLQPKSVILGFYAGNDLFDCFKAVYHQDALTEYRSTDEKLLEAISQAKSSAPFVPAFQSLTAYGRELLKNECALYGFARGVRNTLRGSVEQYEDSSWESTKSKARGMHTIDTDKAKTVFRGAHRLKALNSEDVRIQEGHRIALSVIEKMKVRLSQEGVEFAVLLFPTKELVFAPLVKEVDENIPSSYLKMVDCEERMWEETKAFFKEKRIEYIDLLPTLRDSLDRGVQPYRKDSDGHLNPLGCKAVAELLNAEERALFGASDL